MIITPYNKDEAIEMLKARALLHFLRPQDAEAEKDLWDICSTMTPEEAEAAIKAFEATQTA